MPERDVWDLPGMPQALRIRDISTVYGLLTRVCGVSQRQIAYLTGQSQSEVSEVLKGRQVMSYALLERIATGLGIDRGRLGLAYDDTIALSRGAEKPEEDEDVKRRKLLNLGSWALFGTAALGPVADRAPWRPEPTPTSARIGRSDVDAVGAMTDALDSLARSTGGGAEILTQEATRTLGWFRGAVGTAEIKRDYAAALSRLFQTAGWATFHENHQMTTADHAWFLQAIDLAKSAGDRVAAANAAYHVGVALGEVGADNDGLAWLQMAEAHLALAPPTPRTAEMRAWIGVDSAELYAGLVGERQARGVLSAADEQFSALRGTSPDDVADFHWVAALAELKLGRLDVAHERLALAAERWNGSPQHRQSVLWAINWATMAVQDGEGGGYDLAHKAIIGVQRLRSSRAKDRLRPLIVALNERSQNSDARELSHLGRQVAARHAA